MSELAVIDQETGELVPLQPAVANLFGTDDPRQVIERAHEHAKVLADVIKERKLFRVIGDKAHVYVEAWSLLGSMLGVFPVAESVEPVEVEGVAGFKATVKAVTRQGDIVGRATAYCMRDENTWKTRNIHALAGMAETRATSRALRKPLGFIVQLAGYNPTPAEEMPDTAGRSTTTRAPKKASPDQHAKLNAMLAELEADPGVQLPDGHKDWTSFSRWIARDKFGVESRSQLTTAQMGELITFFDTDARVSF